MKIRVIPAIELCERLRTRWCEIVSAAPSLQSPYFHPEFTLAVARVRSDVWVAVIEDGNSIAAFFPFQRGPIRTGRPVGGPLSDCHGLVAPPCFEIDASRLLRGAGLASWTFDHGLACQSALARWTCRTSESPLIEMPNGYETYAAERRAAGSKQIPKAEGLARKLEREIGPLIFSAHSTDELTLRRCIEWKRTQYSEMAVNDVLAAPWTRNLLHEIHRTQCRGFSGMLSTLHAGDRLVSVHIGMRSSTVWHYWFPSYDHEMARFSPGILLLLRMAQAAQPLGITCIDLGKGATMYKDRLSSGAVALIEGRVQVPSIATALSHFRESSEQWIRRSPFFTAARAPGRVFKRAERWLRYR